MRMRRAELPRSPNDRQYGETLEWIAVENVTGVAFALRCAMLRAEQLRIGDRALQSGANPGTHSVSRFTSQADLDGKGAKTAGAKAAAAIRTKGVRTGC